MSKQQPEPIDRPTAQAESETDAQATTPSETDMRRLYAEQQRRLRCVGCGEAEELF